MATNVKVAVRVRNLPTWHGRDGKKDGEDYNANCVKLQDQTGINQSIVIGNDKYHKEPKEFSFDSILSSTVGQEQLYRILVEPLITKCLEGFNGCVFVYGQTASGSYLEIYNEQLKDLLSESKDELKIRLDQASVSGKGVYVSGLLLKALKTEKDFFEVVEEGVARRKVAETNMNATSSRSHSVFTLNIEKREFLEGGKEGKKLRSKIHLIDLAGSERVATTGATGETLKEGAAINQSLSALGNVINALATGSSHIPYRDSKLTHLLSDSLGGNSMTLLIACLTPITGAYEESLSTLRFAERVKKIKNKVVLNVDPTTLRIMALEAENSSLKDRLKNCKCGISGPQSVDDSITAKMNAKLKLTVGAKQGTEKSITLKKVAPLEETVVDVDCRTLADIKNEKETILKQVGEIEMKRQHLGQQFAALSTKGKENLARDRIVELEIQKDLLEKDLQDANEKLLVLNEELQRRGGAQNDQYQEFMKRSLQAPKLTDHLMEGMSVTSWNDDYHFMRRQQLENDTDEFVPMGKVRRYLFCYLTVGVILAFVVGVLIGSFVFRNGIPPSPPKPQ